MEITKYQGLPPINEYIAIAEKLAMTNYFIDDDGVLDQKVLVARGFAKIMYGHELGLSPMFSMQHVNIIKGKMTLDAGGVAAKIAGSEKYDYNILSHTDEHCEIQFFRNGELRGTVKWGIEDAKKAKLAKNESGYDKFPKDMYFARAITAGARRYCPDIFGGSVYTPEELGEPETEVSFTVELEPFTDKERKTFHAIGSMLYGEEWDNKRHEIVKWVTNGRTDSSQDLTRSEMLLLIEGMESKQKESIPETVVESPQNSEETA